MVWKPFWKYGNLFLSVNKCNIVRIYTITNTYTHLETIIKGMYEIHLRGSTDSEENGLYSHNSNVHHSSTWQGPLQNNQSTLPWNFSKDFWICCHSNQVTKVTLFLGIHQTGNMSSRVDSHRHTPFWWKQSRTIPLISLRKIRSSYTLFLIHRGFNLNINTMVWSNYV